MPLTELATELLVDIFSHCSPDSSAFDSYIEATSGDYHALCLRDEDEPDELCSLGLRTMAGGDLFALEQVCTRFRDVVRGTPSLWSNIFLDMRGFHLCCFRTTSYPANDMYTHLPLQVDPQHQHLAHAWMIHLLRQALQRGGDILPLTITIWAHDDFPRETLDILNATAHRWQSVALDVPRRMFTCLEPIVGQLASLSALRLVRRHDRRLPWPSSDPLRDKKLLQCFTEAPRLSSLDYDGSESFRTISLLPLEQLSSIQLREVRPAAWRPLLTLMKRFRQDCQLLLELFIDEAAKMGAPLEHFFNALDVAPHSFSIQRGKIRSDSLPLPGPLSVTGTTTYWPGAAAIAMFRRLRSRETLHSLTLNNIPFSEQDVVELISELPSLQFLSVSDKAHPAQSVITDSLLAAVLWLLPQLSVLELHARGDFTDAGMHHFLCARQIVPRPFRISVMWLFRAYSREFGVDLVRTIQGATEAGWLSWQCGIDG
ncbi:hypothetical protein C8F01DRAFT_1362263 [Mycena amicta]|nr:hypothetical protein C8F01DRAFT_1362263 [Mycena amicta]